MSRLSCRPRKRLQGRANRFLSSREKHNMHNKATAMAVVAFTIILLAGVGRALDRQPSSDYRARRQALAAKTEGGVVVLFAPLEAEGPNDLYGFRQDDNFFYLSGWTEPGAALLIGSAAQASAGSTARPYTEILFLPAHNPSQEKWTGPKLGPENPDAPNITGFERVELLDKLRDELVRLLPQPRATVYGDLPSFDKASASAEPLNWLRRGNAFPTSVSFQDVKPLLASLRTFKDSGEIE